MTIYTGRTRPAFFMKHNEAHCVECTIISAGDQPRLKGFHPIPHFPAVPLYCKTCNSGIATSANELLLRAVERV